MAGAGRSGADEAEQTYYFSSADHLNYNKWLLELCWMNYVEESGEFTHWQNWYFLLTRPQRNRDLLASTPDGLLYWSFVRLHIYGNMFGFSKLNIQLYLLGLHHEACSFCKTWGLLLNWILTNEGSIWPLKKCCRVASAFRKVYFLTVEKHKSWDFFFKAGVAFTHFSEVVT